MNSKAQTAKSGILKALILLVVAIILGVASGAAIASIKAVEEPGGPEAVRAAKAAAKHAVHLAEVRQQTVEADAESECLKPDENGQIVYVPAQVGGWCPPVSGQAEGGVYTYQVKPDGTGIAKLAAVGTVDTEMHRIDRGAGSGR